MVSHMLRAACLLLLGCLMPLPHAAAQGYPAKPVRVIMIFTPGGVSDALVRAVTDKASAALGQPFVIEHKPGAAGTLAAAFVAAAPADGYTLLFASTGLSVNATLHKNLQYDLLKDLAPITMAASGPWVLFVSQNLQAETVRDLITAAKSRPGALNYASVGIGSSPHLLGVMLSRATGIEMTHVPYKGVGPILTDMASGQVHMTFNAFGQAEQFRSVGRSRMLAVTSAKRLEQAPQVPTLGEFIPGFSLEGWYGFFAPAGIPRAVLERLNAEFTKAIAAPEISERIARLGFSPLGQSLGEAAQFMAKDVAIWREAVIAAGATAE
jgi:tripartite-type tricarboxylate transporter receptor subunit TctC